MDKKATDPMKKVLKYSIRRAYFGTMTAAELEWAYDMLRRSQTWDKPIEKMVVHVGHIDNADVCRALWQEMSYNPKRFGTKSPFMHKGKASLYRFCEKPVSQDVPGFKVLEKIRVELIDYMSIIPNPDGGWNANINDNRGLVNISLVDGHADKNYEKLTQLRAIIRTIITQNLKDYEKKSYRDEIVKAINENHPDGVRSNKPFVAKKDEVPESAPLVITDLQDDLTNEGEEERIQYEIDEHWRKTQEKLSVEEYKNREFEQYNQVCDTCEKLKNAKFNNGKER